MRRRQVYAAKASDALNVTPDVVTEQTKVKIGLLWLGHECPKCKRIFKRGFTMHMKYCKGNNGNPG